MCDLPDVLHGQPKVRLQDDLQVILGVGRQFRNSNIFKSLVDIEAEPDINKNPDFFSYEDFYVIYIKFWELDNDHDFQLSREELSKYSGYTLSRKTLERIFSQTVKKFQYE